MKNKNKLKSVLAALLVGVGAHSIKSPNNNEAKLTSSIVDVSVDSIKDILIAYSDEYCTNMLDKEIISGLKKYLLYSINVDETNKSDIILNLDSDGVKEYVIKYVLNTYEDYKKIPRIKFDDTKLNKTLENIDILKESAITYDLPLELLVALQSYNDNPNDPFNLSSWKSRGKDDNTSYTVYDFKNKKRDTFYNIDLNNDNYNASSKNSARVFRQCLKESSGVLYNPNSMDNNDFDAIDYYIDRGINDKYSKMKREEHLKLKNIILNIILYLSNDYKTILSYNYTITNNYETDGKEYDLKLIYSDLESTISTRFDNIIPNVLPFIEANAISYKDGMSK